jgi:hypothetical protein
MQELNKLDMVLIEDTINHMTVAQLPNTLTARVVSEASTLTVTIKKSAAQ